MRSIRKTSISSNSACKLRVAAAAEVAAAEAVAVVEAAAVEAAGAEAAAAAVAVAVCPGELAAGARLEHCPLTGIGGYGRVMVSTRPISCVARVETMGLGPPY